ncbi:MAG: ribosome maturation factor RimM [Bacteroidaceae bacterium]|nr:ribosome maturation factor RimM [Bacteroidaceae bacterium]
MGSFLKPHGVNGEMVLTVPESMDWNEDLDCLICRMDGILVPFFIESVREKSATSLLVKFENVDCIQDTQRFIGCTVFLPKKFAVEYDNGNSVTWHSFIDWTVLDTRSGNLGTVTSIDDSTPNILFLVKSTDRERIIPANEVWITNIDWKKCIITFNLPEGLVDL